MKRVLAVAGLCWICMCQGFALPTMADHLAIIADWMDKKPFHLDKIKFADDGYTRNLLNNPPSNLEASLDAVGVSLFSLLRNEVYARHGYLFKSDVLLSIFRPTSWYRFNPKFTFDVASSLENANVKAIQDLEGHFDYDVIETWLRSLDSFSERFVSGTDFAGTQTESKVRFALNHLKWLPAAVLRNLILAQHGGRAPDSAYQRLFADLLPGQTGNLDLRAVSDALSPSEKANIEFLQLRELYEMKDAVTYNMPAGVTALPALGAELYFYKTIPAPWGDLHYGGLRFGFLNREVKVTNHRTTVEVVLPGAAKTKVEQSSGALAKVQAFFQVKAYSGYTDSIVFNQSDFTPPEVIAEALKIIGLDYLQLLRREIAARHGAEIADPAYTAVFAACSWYRPKYKATLDTESRLPAKVVLSREEQSNFALLEGEMVYRSKVAYERLETPGFALVDMNTVQTRWVDFGTIGEPQKDGSGTIDVGAFRDPRASGPIDFDALVDSIKDKNGFQIFVSYGAAC